LADERHTGASPEVKGHMEKFTQKTKPRLSASKRAARYEDSVCVYGTGYGVAYDAWMAGYRSRRLEDYQGPRAQVAPADTSVHAERIRALRPTFTVAALAAKFSLSEGYVYQICRGVAGPRGNRPGRKPAYDVEALRERYRGGETLQAIGASIGITREAVRQAMRLTRADGGKAAERRTRREEYRKTAEYWRKESRQRLRAAGWRKCNVCGDWDSELTVYGKAVVHLDCAALRKRAYNAKRFGAPDPVRSARQIRAAEKRWGRKMPPAGTPQRAAAKVRGGAK
jgi:hypothetical protein